MGRHRAAGDEGRGLPGSAPGRVLPEELRPEMRRAVGLAVALVAYLLVDVVVLYLLASGSASILAVIVQDALELVAPVAFLVTAKVHDRPPDGDFPYGYHRSVTLGSFVSSIALLAFGLVLLLFSARSLLHTTHPTIGTIEVFGEVFWRGWVVLGWLAVSTAVPVTLGRLMVRSARRVNNRVLHDAADMMKADWQTTGAGVVGMLGIGFGLWWLDPVAAILIATLVVLEGVQAARRTGSALMDRTPTEVGTTKTVELVGRIEGLVEAAAWTGDAEVRLREEGQVYFGEVLVAVRRDDVAIDDLEDLAQRIRDLDWRLRDVLVVPTRPERSGDPVHRDFSPVTTETALEHAPRERPGGEAG